MPERANIVYDVSKRASGPEVIASFSAQLNLAWNLYCSDVMKCWRLNSKIKIREVSPCTQENIYVQVNNLVFKCS